MTPMLSSSSSNAWMPAPGRYPVDIGSSLGRALRARKNEMEMSSSGSPAVPVRSKGRSLPERDFFSFRYGHKPQSIDPQKPGQIEFTTNDAPTGSANEQTKIVLERASTQPGESVMFRGQQATPNKYDCVLIFDEDSGTFTLEKLDDGITLTHDRSLQPIISRQLPEDPSPSPAPSTKAASARDKIPTKRVPKIPKYEAPDEQIAEVDDIDDEIAKMLPPEPKLSAPIPNASRYKKEEEEDEEEEGRPLLQQQQEQRRYISTNKKETKPSRPTKAIPKKKAVAVPSPSAGPPPAPLPTTKPSPPMVTPLSASLPPKPKPAPSAKPQRPAARQTETMTEVFKDVEEFPSVINARSSKPSKAKPQPPLPVPSPPRSSGLALPGTFAQAAIAPPPTLPSSTSIVRQTKTKTVAQPPPPPPPPPAVHDLAEDSDEDDWDDVTPANGATASGSNARIPDDDNISMLEEEIFGSDEGLNLEGEGEGDVAAAIDDEFGRQLEEEMFNLEEEEDDEDADADMEPVEEYDGPISLNALAGGGGMNVDSDDDTSSSDDSEY